MVNEGIKGLEFDYKKHGEKMSIETTMAMSVLD
jgi:hypothetical protein